MSKLNCECCDVKEQVASCCCGTTACKCSEVCACGDCCKDSDCC